MAANDYYHPETSYSFHQSSTNYNSSPPPPPPSSLKPGNSRPSNPSIDTSHQAHSSSPFDDTSYPAQTSYPNDSYDAFNDHSPQRHAGYPHGQDPFADSIPLQDHHGKTDPPSPSPASKPYEPYAGQDSAENGAAGKRKRRGTKLRAKRRIPWFVYIMTLIQVTVFIAEIVKNSILTKSPIAIHPQFNPMIGPSPWVLISMGARYVPCMRAVDGIQNAAQPLFFPCPNTTTSDTKSPSMQCSLSEVCGFQGVPNPKVGGSVDDNPQPNQWFRFIVPIFLHAGLIHISFNMLLQLLLGADIERAIGPFRFALVYFSSGIFGFVLGGNFAPPMILSTGASGCLFGVLALVLLDLLYSWKERPSPVKDLCFILLDMAISFVLGLLPGLDNFSHIGGFLMGLVLGVCILHSPNALRKKIDEDAPPYTPMASTAITSKITFVGVKGFSKKPLGFFKGRKPLWWAWWLIRVGALIGVLVGFIVLLNNFYKYHDQCKWCKHLSCLPISNWCDIGNIHLTNITTPSKRDLLRTMDEPFTNFL